jgi:hypothetical protein
MRSCGKAAGERKFLFLSKNQEHTANAPQEKRKAEEIYLKTQGGAGEKQYRSKNLKFNECGTC